VGIEKRSLRVAIKEMFISTATCKWQHLIG